MSRWVKAKQDTAVNSCHLCVTSIGAPLVKKPAAEKESQDSQETRD